MEETIFITAAEMAEILGISKPYAYKIIKQMNEDLEGPFGKGKADEMAF